MKRPPRRIALLVSVGALVLLASACNAPAVAPAPAPAAVAASNCGGADAVAAQILARANGARAANGIGPLHWDGQLMCLASSWSRHMASTQAMVHQNLSAVLGRPEYQRYRTLGENILRGPAGISADAMHDAWMASPGHRANILSGAFSSFAAASAIGPDGLIYVAAEFGG